MAEIKKRIDWFGTFLSIEVGESIEMSGLSAANNARRAASVLKSSGKGEWTVFVTNDKKSKFKITRVV